jgi:hypothetical protein
MMTVGAALSSAPVRSTGPVEDRDVMARSVAALLVGSIGIDPVSQANLQKCTFRVPTHDGKHCLTEFQSPEK